jgi:hypothetical protein
MIFTSISAPNHTTSFKVFINLITYLLTQTEYPNHNVWHALPTLGFHLLKFAFVMLYCFTIVSHVFPLTTLCHFLHPQTAPGCVGVGADGLHVGFGVADGFLDVGVGFLVGVPGIPMQ